jgi:signal peptidase I
VGWCLAAVAVGVPVLLGVARFGLHLDLAAVRTGSMRPVYAPGDAVVTHAVPVKDLAPGMIVLATPAGQSTPFAHRIVSVTRHPGRTIVATKGDANPQRDAWTDTFTGESAQRVVAVVPKAGYVVAALQDSAHPGDLAFTVLVPLLTITAITLVLLAPARRPRAVTA